MSHSTTFVGVGPDGECIQMKPASSEISPYDNPKAKIHFSSLGLARLSSKIQASNTPKTVPKHEYAMLPIIENFIAWVNYELKYMSGLETKKLAILYTLPNNVNRWTVEDVYTFLHTLGFKHTAVLLYRNAIDGLAFTLLRRVDLLHGLGIRIGSAMKLYAYVERIRQDFLVDLDAPDI